MKILIVKTSSLGDILQTFPVVEYLKKRDPEATIDWVAEAHCAPLVEAHPNVSKVFSVESRAWRKGRRIAQYKQFVKELQSMYYDVIFDFQGNTKSGISVSIARGRDKVGFGAKTVPEWPNLLMTNRRFNPDHTLSMRCIYLQLAQRYFGDEGTFTPQGVTLLTSSEEKAYAQEQLQRTRFPGRKQVLVCPGSAWKNKQLTSETLLNFLSLLDRHYGCGFTSIWGSEEEKQLVEELSSHFSHATVLDKVSFPVLQLVMLEMDLVIAMDSLPLHLAGLGEVPIYAVFGPSSARKYLPEGDNVHAFQGECPYGNVFEKRCSILKKCPTGACIRGVTGEQLFAHFQKMNVM